jgi:flagellin
MLVFPNNNYKGAINMVAMNAVRTNITGVNAHRQLSGAGLLQEKSGKRLASGQRINSAADDVTGSGIVDKMRAQIGGLDQAYINAQDGVNLLQTAEGGLASVNEMLLRMRELLVKAANDTYAHDEDVLMHSDRVVIQDELEQIMFEINNIATRAEFNTRNLLSGDYCDTVEGSTPLWFQIGANGGQGINVNIAGASTRVLALVVEEALSKTDYPLIADPLPSECVNVCLANLIDVEDPSGEDISKQIRFIDAALTHVNGGRANLGAVQNRLEFAQIGLGVTSENLTTAVSRIRDADMAKELMAFTLANFLTQSSTAMIAMANQAPQSVMQLLQN